MKLDIRRRQQQIRQMGATLLELLLALAVIAAIVLYLSVHMKNQTQEKQLQQTSVEMQTILQAAASYYLFQQHLFYTVLAGQPFSDKNIIETYFNSKAITDIARIQESFWPQSFNDLISATQHFLHDQTQLCASWPYQAGEVCPLNNTRAGYQIQSFQHYFGVAIVMPNPDLALKLLAKLPGGAIDSNNTSQVWAYIPRPVSHYNPPLMMQTCHPNNPLCTPGEKVGARGWIASAGAVSADRGDPTNQLSLTEGSEARAIILPNCPDGYEGHYIMSMMRVQTGNQVDYDDFDERGTLGNFQMNWHLNLYPDSILSDQQQVSTDSTIGGYYWYTCGGERVGCPKYFYNPSGIYPWGRNRGKSELDTGFMVNYFLTLCIPAKHWFVHLTPGNEQLCNSKKGINQNHLGYVTQCQDDWPVYNVRTNTAQCPVTSDDKC